MEKLDGKTFDIVSDNIKKLEELFPELVTEGKVDIDKLALLFDKARNESSEDGEERYEFTWKGKKEAIRLSQKQTTGTLRPCREESVNFDETQNLYIEGDNLEVLRILQNSYRGKVKMIYIDPPYNTGKDFVYKDDFSDNVKNYKEKMNDSFKTNTDTSGRFHTNWLNMMYPRLKLARNLLTDDGIIFISIDDNEVDNLRKICDEIFGENNFVGRYIWKNKSGGGGKQGKNNPNKQDTKNEAFVIDHEYILCFVKNRKLLDRFNVDLNEDDIKKYINIDNDIRGSYILEDLERSIPTPISTLYYPLIDPDGIEIRPKGGKFQWRRSLERVNKEFISGEIIWYKVKNAKDNRGYYYRPKTKQYLYDLDGKIRTKSSRSVLLDNGFTRDGAIELRELFNGSTFFDYPKPVKLLKYLFKMTVNKNDIILDFFSGSSTTSHAVMQLNAEDGGNRKFIMVQIPEETNEKSEAYKSGYKNICEIGKERIRRAGKKILEENKDKEGIDNLDIGFKVFKLDTTNIKEWDDSVQDIDEIKWNVEGLINPIKEDRSQEDIVYEILLKYGIDLTVPIEEVMGYKVYSVGFGYLMICLEKNIDLDLIEAIGEQKPNRVVLYDKGLENEIKLNAMEIFKKYGVEDIRTI